MPTNLQVVLQQDVDKLGKSGEVVKVRPGYARNFLLPRGYAVPATTAHLNRISHEKAVAIAKADKLKKEMQDLAAKISALVVQLPVKVGDDDRLFGSVTAKEIHHAVVAKGVDFDRKKLVLAEPIKALGTYELVVKLLGDITATLKVEVVKK
jgi:large subunit ribosomal protein L9